MDGIGAKLSEGLDNTSRVPITGEARAMGRLGDHSNILPIHDLGEEYGHPYLVLRPMEGGNLNHLLDSVTCLLNRSWAVK